MAPSQKSSAPLPPQRFPESSNGGRPKNPTRNAPRPARHIPWPEIFKHHISLVEGHLKMIDMVRKHTIEGSDNHRTICDIIDNTKRILSESKTVSRIFVPPPSHIDQVPLGSSSESMYPGYSTKDHHKYDETAQNIAAEAKWRGEKSKPEGVDYELGQSKAPSSLKLEQMRATKAAPNGAGPGSDTLTPVAPSDANASSKRVRFSDVSNETSKPEGQVFFMDSQPTPIDLPTSLNPSHKRKGSSQDPHAAPEPMEAQPTKRAKTNHADHAVKLDDVYEDKQPIPNDTAQTNGEAEQAPKDFQIEYEDISAEVDQRMKEKEEKRKTKNRPTEEKKRKRDSEGSTAGAVESAAKTELEKPKKKKKKSKTPEDAETAGEVSPKKDSMAAGEDVDEGAVEKPKKKRKVKASPENATAAKDESAGDESSPKKKAKKAKSSSNTASTDKKHTATQESTPSKRPLIEHPDENAEGEQSNPKKKKANVSKGAPPPNGVAVQEKGQKRPAEVAEVGDVEGEGKKKKQKKSRKSI
ncbi:MAG: hypothetical protein LQ349_002315 [Xanthoria aureola]|nr:MAG: hypothetical protein LQ349_002315 [Xanthoria aureola]